MREESRFHEGDRVYAVSDIQTGEDKTIRTGDTGTVLIICSHNANHEEDDIGVRWDVEIGGHTLGGRCDKGHGWYVYARSLKLIPEPEHEDFEPATDDELMCFLYGREA